MKTERTVEVSGTGRAPSIRHADAMAESLPMAAQDMTIDGGACGHGVTSQDAAGHAGQATASDSAAGGVTGVPAQAARIRNQPGTSWRGRGLHHGANKFRLVRLPWPVPAQPEKREVVARPCQLGHAPHAAIVDRSTGYVAWNHVPGGSLRCGKSEFVRNARMGCG